MLFQSPSSKISLENVVTVGLLYAVALHHGINSESNVDAPVMDHRILERLNFVLHHFAHCLTLLDPTCIGYSLFYRTFFIPCHQGIYRRTALGIRLSFKEERKTAVEKHLDTCLAEVHCSEYYSVYYFKECRGCLIGA